MKAKFILTACLAFYAAISFCQTDWAPAGATWYYSSSEGNPLEAYKAYQYEKDTVIGGKTCKVINGFYSLDKNFSQEEIMYEEAGKVYYFFKDKFRKIYDFTLQKGDLVDFEFNGYSKDSWIRDTVYTVNFRVEDVSTVPVNGKMIKKFTTVETAFSSDSIQGNSYVYYEKIGNLQEFIRTQFSYPSMHNRNFLRCYTDADIQYVSDEWLPNKDKSCDYIFTSPIVEPVIDSLKIIPALPSINDEVKFAVFMSEPFSGNCTYEMKFDSIIGQTIYVGGKIDSNNKCGSYNAAINDTINIGLLLNTGVYDVVYNLSDANGVMLSKRISLDFKVSAGYNIPETNNPIVFSFNRELRQLMIQTNPANDISISLYGLTGILYAVKQIIQHNTFTMDLSKIPSGVYIVTVRDKQGNNICAKKLIL